MRKKKTDTGEIIERARHFNTVLVGESALVGLIADGVTLLYRLGLEYADRWLHGILEFADGKPVLMAG